MFGNNEQLITKKCNCILNKINTVDKSKAPREIVIEKNPGRPPTVFVATASKKVYLHSKYNPYEEAERIIEHLENIDTYDYVVFFGFALGYHVEYFMKKFPHIHFSIFEPEFDVFKKCLDNRDLSFLESNTFDSFYFPDIDATSEEKLQEILNHLNCSIQVIPLTSYESAFPSEYNKFYKIFGQYFDNTTIIDNTKKHHEKLYTINALNNFRYIMETPNILKQNNGFFRNKPAIIVSAGPSLEYEIENLKYIEENGLAYIFSAGSAINTLIDNKVHPHACLSIDPTPENQKVYEKMISLGIKSIPLIFATTAGTAVVESYPGNLYHFITTKDLVSPYYAGSNPEAGEFTDSASSVAVVALVLLHKLGFSPIILVGQNLAYKDQRYYSEGIDYNLGAGTIDSSHFENLYIVQSVDGGLVYSDDSLNCFRKDMEHYIRSCNIGNVINTTRNGAVIKGTTYKTLDGLLKYSLRDMAVDPEWEVKLQNNYNKQLIKEQSISTKAEIDKFYNIIQRLNDLSGKIYFENNKSGIEILSTSFYEIFDDIIKNRFFHVFLYSMNVYQCKMLIKDIRLRKSINTPTGFSISLFEKFMEFINACIKDLEIVLPLIEELDKQLS